MEPKPRWTIYWFPRWRSIDEPEETSSCPLSCQEKRFQSLPCRLVLSIHLPLQLRVITTKEEFTNLEQAWDETLERSSNDHISATFAFERTWWEHFGSDCVPHIILAESNGKVVGIAPLMISTVKRAGVRVRKASFMLPRYLGADFIIEKGREAECIELFLQEIMSGEACQYLELSGLTDESTSKIILERVARQQGMSFSLDLHSEGCYLRLTGSWDNFMGRRSWKLRKNINHDLRSFQDNKGFRVARIRDPLEFEGAMEMAAKIDAQSWKARLPKTSGEIRFRRELLLALASRGKVDFFALELGESPVAYWLFVMHRSKAYAFYTSYDHRFSSRSPGGVLLYLALEELFKEGRVSEVDFITSYPYLKRWTELKRRRFVATLYPHGIEGRFVHLARKALHSKETP